MTAYLILLLLAGLALGVSFITGLRGSWLTLTTAALLLGAAGYAVHGRPGLAGSPRAGTTPEPPISLVKARNAFLGEFTGRSHWLVISDSYSARGQTRDAVGILQSATRLYPRDYALWLDLGNALTDHARVLTPAARLAFARSAELAPTNPAPAYFLGLAKLRSGDPAGALADWKEVLANAPANASWRPFVEDGVALVEPAITAR